MPAASPTPVTTHVAAIVLAAGASRRMGSPKALLEIGGRRAVEVVVSALREGGVARVVVVLGCHAAEIRAVAKLDDATVIDHAAWEEGRTSSLQAGLREIPAAATGVLVAPVDMPYFRGTTVAALLRAFEGVAEDVRAVVPVHEGRRGHPVLLARALFRRVNLLGPDAPLRYLVREAKSIEVPVDDPGVLIDLDTPEDATRAAAERKG
jgi:molybdenum cofactor cytidylyltransferase